MASSVSLGTARHATKCLAATSVLEGSSTHKWDAPVGVFRRGWALYRFSFHCDL